MQFRQSDRRRLRSRRPRARRPPSRAPRTSASPRTRTTSRSWPTTASPSASAAATAGSPASWSPTARAARAPASTPTTPTRRCRRSGSREQRKAAYVGEYACQIQLGYPSSAVKDPRPARRARRSRRPSSAPRSRTSSTCTTSPTSTTRTSACACARIAALRALARRVPAGEGLRLRGLARPGLADRRGQAGPPRLRRARTSPRRWSGVFDSQISGGKRYDLATQGRRIAHATYFASHGTDEETALSFAMDLTPLVHNPDLPVTDYVLGFIDQLRADVQQRMAKLG